MTTPRRPIDVDRPPGRWERSTRHTNALTTLEVMLARPRRCWTYRELCELTGLGVEAQWVAVADLVHLELVAAEPDTPRSIRCRARMVGL